MKKTLRLLSLAALTIGLLGSCAKIEERISNLEKRVDGIEATSIASVQQQIDGIKTSINDLKAADAAINVRIDELKSYVDTEIGKAKDWAEETFATLDQYEQTADDLAALSVTVTGISTTLAGVQTSISGLDTKIDGISTELQGKITSAKTELEGKIATAISNSETSIKTWINELLEGYYTAAQVDAKITGLNTAIDAAKGTAKERIDSVAKELTTLKTAVDTAKAAIRTEYKTAIATAITKLDGEIRGALLDSIAAVNGRAEALDTRVTDLESRMLAVEGNVNKLLAMIQSVSITPAYSDGSVEAVDGILTLKCVVSPAEALTGMQSLKDSLLIYADYVKVKTKSSPAYTEIAVGEATVLDAEQGAITLKADISEYLPKGADQALTVALKIKNGISDFTTEFVPVYVAPGPVLPDGALKGAFTVNADGKKVYFSKGNLQASVAASIEVMSWKFAANQYDYLGEGGANKTIGQAGGDVDLFGWSTDAASNNWGIHTKTSTSNDFTAGSFNDWGKAYCEKNGIAKGTWSTLSKDEWIYLFNTRTMANGGSKYENLMSGITIQGVEFKGVVLFPDDFKGQTTWKTTYTTWEALKNAGLVFLPAAGNRTGFNVSNVGANGFYWSSTVNNDARAYHVLFKSGNVTPGDYDSRYYGYSVRLVTEGVTPKPVVPVTGVTLNKTELSLKAGETETLTATVLPADTCIKRSGDEQHPMGGSPENG